jgi:uracil-DNA glycosylase family 4
VTRSKPYFCFGCELCSAGTDFSQPEGLGTLGVALVGEASGEHESRDQLPFRPFAPSGMILERTLRRLGYTRDQFAITNVLRCKPWGNELAGTPYEFSVIDSCKPNLLAFLRQFKPKVIVAFGNIPFRTLTGISGAKRSISHSRGYVFRALPEYCAAVGVADLLVVPTYHPAFLRRGAIHLTGVLARDIQRAVNIRQGRDRSFILDMPKMVEEFLCKSTMSLEEAEAAEAESVRAWLARYNLRYNLKPTRSELDAFCRDTKAKSEAWQALPPSSRDASLLALSFDTETYESVSLDEDATEGYVDTRLRLFQFSTQPGTGLALSWEGEHIQAVRWLLKLALPKVGHNLHGFDLRVMQATGLRDYHHRQYFWPNGPIHDTLLMFRYWQPDLPAHLQFASTFCGFPFPWKHLSDSSIEVYGIADVDSALRLYGTLRRTMHDRGIWSDTQQPEREAAGFVSMVEQTRPILAAMEDRGLPIDDQRRLALDVEFEEAEREALIELDARFPNAARKVTPKVAGRLTGYTGVPPEVCQLLDELAPLPESEFLEQRKPDGKVIWINRKGEKVTKKLVQETLKQQAHARAQAVTSGETPADINLRKLISQRVFNEPSEMDPNGKEVIGETYRYEVRRVGQVVLDENLGLTTAGELKWFRVYQFSPNSPAQLLSYMAARKHKIPTKKTGENTTDKVSLLRLATQYKDNFYTKVADCRELRKMRGTYINGFKPRPDTGCVHTTFTYDTATMQLSSRNPNIQTAPKHGKLAKAVRSMIRQQGKLLVEWDFKSYHVLTTGYCAKDLDYMRLARLDMHSFVAGHFNKDWDAFKLFAQPDEELAERFRWFKKDPDRKFLRDKKAKPCIAEGELVLTDRGLVPIQDITLAHRVWDGVEWVSHGGLIDKGIQEVITYDGLTATPDHVVFLENGFEMAFGRAASSLARLASTGVAGQAVRFSHGHLLERSARKRIHQAFRSMYEMSKETLDRQVQPTRRRHVGLPVMQSDQINPSRGFRPKVRRDCVEMLFSTQFEIRRLWWPGNNLQVQDSKRVCTVGGSESPSRELQGRGDRPDRQQWPLRAGEPAPCNSKGAVVQSSNNRVGFLQRESDSTGRVRFSLRLQLDSTPGQEQEDDWRASNRACHSQRSGSILQDTGSLEKVVSFARVYDIADAGPRKCYTVSGKLVANCILGIGFGLGVNKLYDMNRESFSSLSEASAFMQVIRSLFPKVFAWQEAVRQQAHREGFLKNAFGAIRWFYEVYAPDGKGGWKPGEQSEQAIAFLPASLAFGNIREAMKELERRGLNEKWSLRNTVHDSLLNLIDPSRLEEHQQDIYPVLHAPSKVLVDPVVAPTGLVVDVECSVGEDWGIMKEVEVKVGGGGGA